jgi:hypothetical protein
MKPTRIICLLVAVAAIAGTARPAAARSLASVEPRLAPVASEIAGRPLTVDCYQHGEPNDPWQMGAWAYVDLFESTVNLSQQACDGAMAIVDGDVSKPMIEQALGALTLTHEAFHLRLTLPFARRASEAQTECRAVKNVYQTMLDLGATSALADELMPWALAVHFKVASLSDRYDWPGCQVPYFSGFWP